MREKRLTIFDNMLKSFLFNKNIACKNYLISLMSFGSNQACSLKHLTSFNEIIPKVFRSLSV